MAYMPYSKSRVSKNSHELFANQSFHPDAGSTGHFLLRLFGFLVSSQRPAKMGHHGDPGKPSKMRGRAHGWNMMLEVQCLVFTFLAKPSRLVSIQACLELAGFPGLYRVIEEHQAVKEMVAI